MCIVEVHCVYNVILTWDHHDYSSTSEHNRMVQDAILKEILNQPNCTTSADLAKGYLSPQPPLCVHAHRGEAGEESISLKHCQCVHLYKM